MALKHCEGASVCQKSLPEAVLSPCWAPSHPMVPTRQEHLWWCFYTGTGNILKIFYTLRVMEMQIKRSIICPISSASHTHNLSKEECCLLGIHAKLFSHSWAKLRRGPVSTVKIRFYVCSSLINLFLGQLCTQKVKYNFDYLSKAEFVLCPWTVTVLRDVAQINSKSNI